MYVWGDSTAGIPHFWHQDEASRKAKLLNAALEDIIAIYGKSGSQSNDTEVSKAAELIDAFLKQKGASNEELRSWKEVAANRERLDGSEWYMMPTAPGTLINLPLYVPASILHNMNDESYRHLRDVLGSASTEELDQLHKKIHLHTLLLRM
ncbi:MAG: hypothetical protein ACP5UH_03680 [Candidatus Micrarchaeia archaeon]